VNQATAVTLWDPTPPTRQHYICQISCYTPNMLKRYQ